MGGAVGAMGFNVVNFPSAQIFTLDSLTKQQIIDQMFADPESVYWRNQVEQTILQAYSQGESLKALKESLLEQPIPIKRE